MKTNTVTRIDRKKILSINPVLERELPGLESERLADLRTAIKRDGVREPIAFWHNPETGKDEIIDGHHRHKIAVELGILYDVQEIDFTWKTITAVKYWMHINQSGRRGGSRNLKRMLELRQKMTNEPKAEAVRQVANDANVSERAVYKSDSKPREKPSVLDQVIKLLSRLSDDDREKLRELL